MINDITAIQMIMILKLKLKIELQIHMLKGFLQNLMIMAN